MRPAGAPTTSVASRSARNACEAPGGESGPNRRRQRASGARAELGQERVARRRLGIVRDAERARVLAPAGGEHGQLARLGAVRVAQRHAVVALQPHHGRAAGADPVQLPRRVGRLEPGDLQRLDRHA